MYEAFFGLRERPFQLTPNPRFLYLNAGHREALATLRYGLTSSPGITLLLGEAGTGKTTLLHAALSAEQRPTHRNVVLSNPTLTRSEFYEILADRCGLPHAAGSKARFLLDFQRGVLERHGAGGVTALVIDEAQSLPHELFEEVRLLANLETPTAKLVNVVLVGQRELADHLNDPSLRQLKQRVSLRCSLAPFTLPETAAYIATRLKVAGADASGVFTKEAVRAIHEASGGIPRTISVVCENALLGGYAAHVQPVDHSIVADVCRDFDLAGNGRPPREHAAAPGPPAGSRPVPPHRATAGVEAVPVGRAVAGPEAVPPHRAAAEFEPVKVRWATTERPAPREDDEERVPVAAHRPRRFWFF